MFHFIKLTICKKRKALNKIMSDKTLRKLDTGSY